jgi:phosphoglucosamine mutase
MRYFGTDGIRGVANVHPMTPEFALRLGRAACRVMSKYSDKKIVIIGTDTRRSCKMLESALLSGILSEGYDCALLGVIPTSGVAYLARKMDAAFAIMISASHNPHHDNGIKLFSHEGFKLKREIEEDIEANIPSRGDEPKEPDEVGRLLEFYEGFPPVSIYINHLINNYFGKEIKDKKIIVDCSNGSASSIARPILYRIASSCEIIHDSPNGLNINENCGSTKMESLINYVKSSPEPAVGIAFDGDADRVLMVDEDGEYVDGDELIAILAKHMKEKGELTGNRVVVTVMSNLGFMKAMEKEGIDVEVTQVGDRYVLHRMIEKNIMIGGEQSGHIILSKYNTTGDGFQTALAILSVMSDTGKDLRELKKVMTKYPQVLKNGRIRDKKLWLEDEKLQQEVQALEKELGGDGRLFIRPSGTEPLIRVMVEGKDLKFIDELASRAMDMILKKIGE